MDIEHQLRSLNLCKLSNIELTSELKKLDDIMTYFQNILDKIEKKEDTNLFPDERFYFIGNDLYMTHLNQRHFYINKLLIVDFIVKEYGYNIEESIKLISTLIKKHFNMKECTITMLVTDSGYVRMVEKHFKD